MRPKLTLGAPVLSEDYALALRRRDHRAASEVSPYFACLLPLLESLGWDDFHRDVLEALPHFSATLDLADFRNVMINLGFESDELRVQLPNIDPRLMPAIFLGKQGEILLLQSVDEASGRYRYFDARTNEQIEGELAGRGKLYVFTDSTATGATAAAPNEAFFSALVGRFQDLVKHLLGMTLIINLVAVASPLFIMTIYDRVIGAHTLDSLPYLVGGIGFALCIELCLRLLRATTLGTIAGRIDYLIGTLSFKQVLALPPIMTERSSVTAQLTKLRSFDSVRDFFAGQTATTLIEVPFITLFLAMVALLGGWLALIPCSVALAYLVFGLFWVPRMRAHLQHSAVTRAHREQVLMETFGGLRELKALGAEQVWLDRYRESTAAAVLAGRRAAIDSAMLTSLTSAVMSIAATAMLGFGTLQVLAGSISVGALIAIMTLTWRVLAPLQGLFMACFRFESITAGIRDLNRLMAIKTERHGRISSLLSQTIDGRVAFERVSFRYGPEYDPALIGVSFDVPARTFLAVVGHNGSGKSTLLKLINGLYAMQSGTVYIDDVDTRQFNAADLRRAVAYVPQNPSVFRGTIAQNLRMKDPMATDNDLRLACFKTGILRMVEGLPDGFNTLIGDENTSRLPSGLIRGICIARAFVSKAPILLLDEPASGLDTDADESLMLQLRSLKGRITVIMASHRPSHIKLADRVLVIERGMTTRLCSPAAYYAKDQANSAPARQVANG